MVKLKLHSIVDLVLYAVRNQIIHVQVPVQYYANPGTGQPSASPQALD